MSCAIWLRDAGFGKEKLIVKATVAWGDGALVGNASTLALIV
jgi:hypothetical protein